jgi:hypothetical protein
LGSQPKSGQGKEEMGKEIKRPFKMKEWNRSTPRIQDWFPLWELGILKCSKTLGQKCKEWTLFKYNILHTIGKLLKCRYWRWNHILHLKLEIIVKRKVGNQTAITPSHKQFTKLDNVIGL